MEQNIFEEYQTEKKRLIKIAAQARANNWINEKQEQEIIEKINNSTLTLGVIGQMKCGNQHSSILLFSEIQYSLPLPPR